MARADAAASYRAAGGGAQQLEEGRQHLRDGNISRAVALFQLARMDRDTAAEASNGLAVAYAKLGRADLAERYFRTAIMLEPDDTRYVANLLRLQGQVMLARQRSSAARLASAPLPATAANGPVRAREAEPVHRVSEGEFRIRTIEPDRVPTMTIGYRQAAARPAEDTPAPEASAAELASAGTARSFEVVFAPWLRK
ncbi:MAG: tetratricopeptide repeat protein [Erythrobacter sp.]